MRGQIFNDDFIESNIKELIHKVTVLDVGVINGEGVNKWLYDDLISNMKKVIASSRTQYGSIEAAEEPLLSYEVVVSGSKESPQPESPSLFDFFTICRR